MGILAFPSLATPGLHLDWHPITGGLPVTQRTIFALAGLALAALGAVQACSSHSDGAPATESRSFYLGSTPFFTTAAAFPDWRCDHDLSILAPARTGRIIADSGYSLAK
jgi:hypothetical protein